MEKAYIKTEYIKSLTHQGFAALTGILLNSRKAHMGDEWNCITPLMIAGALTGKEPVFSDFQAVNKGLSQLADLGITTKRRGFYIVNYAEIEVNAETEVTAETEVIRDKYVCLEENEVRAIMNYEGEVNNRSLLQYFAYLKSTFDFRTKNSNYSINFLSEHNKMTVLTLTRYHKILENLGILKIFRFKSFKTPDGQIKSCPNVYCLPKDELEVIHILQEDGRILNLKK